jgi:hypothetical protein
MSMNSATENLRNTALRLATDKRHIDLALSLVRLSRAISDATDYLLDQELAQSHNQQEAQHVTANRVPTDPNTVVGYLRDWTIPATIDGETIQTTGAGQDMWVKADNGSDRESQLAYQNCPMSRFCVVFSGRRDNSEDMTCTLDASVLLTLLQHNYLLEQSLETPKEEQQQQTNEC